MIIKNIKILDRNFEVKEHMNVVVDGEFFSYVGKDEIPMPQANKSVAETQEIIDGNGKFLMPAFYNTHCHVPMTLLRGYGEGLPLQRWLSEKIFPFEKKFFSEYKYWGAKLGALELMKSGCVSISDMYFDLVEYGTALREGGMKANLSNCIVSFNEEESYFDNNAYKDTAKLLNWIGDYNDDKIRADVAIHSEYANKEKAITQACEYSFDNNMIMQVHISETRAEHEECKQRHGMTPIQYFQKCGMFRTPVVAAHCVWLEENDIDIMKSSNAFMSHNISSNLKLGSGIAPIQEYYNKKMNITIGTDGASSNNNLNMLEEIHLSAMVCRGISQDANAVPASDIIKMATLNGAMAQGRGNCGFIEEGNKADFIVFDLDKEHLTPDYDTLANIVFSAQASDIWMTVCDGQVICKDGKSLLIDEEETRAKAKESFNKVLASI